MTAIVVDSFEEAERFAAHTPATILHDADRPPATVVGDLDLTALQRREQLAAVIDDRAFRAVFQPMVALYKSEIVGYEALTRFDDGTPPDRRFSEAPRPRHRRRARARRSRRRSPPRSALPPGRFVSINLSPDLLVLHQRKIEAAIGELHRDHPVVLELTEHDVVADYELLRGSLARFDPAVKCRWTTPARRVLHAATRGHAGAALRQARPQLGLRHPYRPDAPSARGRAVALRARRAAGSSPRASKPSPNARCSPSSTCHSGRATCSARRPPPTTEPRDLRRRPTRPVT